MDIKRTPIAKHHFLMYCQSMKKRDIIVVIAVIGLIFAYLAYGKSRSNTVIPEPVATSTPVSEVATSIPLSVSEIAPFDFEGVVVDTSDWQTYRNEEYGYEFKYPRGWEEIDYYGYLTNKYDIERVKKSYTKQKIVGFRNEDWISVGIVYRGQGFGYEDLVSEWKQTGGFTNYKLTKFVNGENTIIIQTLYILGGGIGYKDNIADVYMWILNKDNEIYDISGNHTEDAGYITGSIEYMTGLYRTFKTIN